MPSASDDFYRYVAQTSPESIALAVEKAEGIYLVTPEGRRVIDFISGICVTNVGHRHPAVVAAVKSQADRYLHAMVYGEAVLSPQVRFARALVDSLAPELEQVYFTNAGAEAIEGALKVAKKFTGRSRIVACKNAYHGSSHGALSVTGNEGMKQGYGPLLPDVHHIPFNDLDALERIDHHTACFLVEAIQGAGGVVLPSAGYLEAVRRRCTEVGALLILDEIQTGFGRTGHLFAHEAYGFVPDILVLAKALGGGLPMGAFVTSQRIIRVIQQDPVLGLISTFGGHPICCAAGLAAFEVIRDENLMDRIPRLETLLRQNLRHSAIVELRGKGLLYALILEDYATADAVRREALKRELLTIGFLNIDNGLRISPPLTITETELVEACRRLVAAIDAVAKSS